jgi:hypothetical protein
VQIVKGWVQALLSRRFVEFLLCDIDVTTFIAQLHTTVLTDEFFWQTLNFDPTINVR